MSNHSTLSREETLKHAYIVAIFKAVVLFSLPFLGIVVYFNLIAAYRPMPLFALSGVIGLFYLIYHFRGCLTANQMAFSLAILTLLAANINCYVNQSVSHAGVAALICAFALSVIPRQAVLGVMLLVTQISLFTSVSLATDFNFEMGDKRWLLVILVGQLTILSGMQLLFSRVNSLFEKEHQLRLESEAATREKSRFLANMSHEIRTPIAGVIGLLRLIKSDNLTTDQQQKLELATQSSELLSNIVDDILDYSKIEAGKLAITPVEFSLDKLLDQVVMVIQTAMQASDNKLSVNKHWDDEIWVKGDVTRLQQVLLNLLSNANKFTQSGDIVLSASIAEQANACRFSCSVKDTGIGMSPEQVNSLFKPFHQLDNSTTKSKQGTGLGLVICKQILTLMGGSITVTSEVQKGSTFSFDLILEKAAPPTASEPVTNPESSLTSLCVLVVEDNVINQTILSEMLSQSDISVEVAENGQHALALLKQKAANEIHVVLMDCQMPVKDGYETTRAIRAGDAGPIWQSIPIIALTANALEGDKDKCLAAGMNDYLSKPVERVRLLGKLRQYVPNA